MFALLLCVSFLLALTGTGRARPLRHPTSSQFCRLGQPMPDLDALVLRSSPRVQATGRLIKGLYYAEARSGLNDMAAFHMACNRLLEPKPFLVMDFRSGRFFLDGDRDGCVDGTGELAPPEIDPADFLPAVEGADDLCGDSLVSQRRLRDPVAVP